jgi:hypothetical protein
LSARLDGTVMARLVPGVGFATVLVAFALPFGAVSSCGGDEKVRFTGAQLATFRVQSDGGDLHDVVERNAGGLAAAVALAALVGLGLSLQGRRGGGICSVLGLIAMQALAVAIVASATGSSSLFVGYWLALAGMGAAGLAHLVAGVSARRSAGRRAWSWATIRVLVALSPTLLLAGAVGVGSLLE